MLNINKMIIAGRVTKVEVNKTKNDKEVVTLTVVTSKAYETNGEKKEQAEWHRVVCWGNNASYAGKYIEKGDTVYVEGEMNTRKWKDKDNNDRETKEVNCSIIQKAPSAKAKEDNKSEKTSNSGFSLED